jgi:SAM-dependent methyltransferase
MTEPERNLDAGRELFDHVVGPYARTRPGYPDEALDWLAAQAGLVRGSRVLDLAAGTGKLTVALAARGYDVIAVEPLPGMRAQLEHDLPGVSALAGSAEQIPLADCSFDAVCVAQAFHWFEPRAAISEIARVLVPGGTLALVWNLWDLADPRQAALDRIVSPLETGSIRHLTTGNHPYGDWSAVLGAETRFAQPVRIRFPHTVELTPDEVGERVASMSQVQAAPAAERDAAIEQARALAAGSTDSRATFRYKTEVEIRQRTLTPPADSR